MAQSTKQTTKKQRKTVPPSRKGTTPATVDDVAEDAPPDDWDVLCHSCGWKGRDPGGDDPTCPRCGAAENMLFERLDPDDDDEPGDGGKLVEVTR